MAMDLQSRIKEAVLSVSTQAEANPDMDEALFESGILDSFALADLVAALEKEFGVQVSDADLRPKNFSSIRQIESYLQSHGVQPA